MRAMRAMSENKKHISFNLANFNVWVSVVEKNKECPKDETVLPEHTLFSPFPHPNEREEEE